MKEQTRNVVVERKKRSLSPDPLQLDLKGNNYYLMTAQNEERLRNCTPMPPRQNFSPEPVELKPKKPSAASKGALPQPSGVV